jgi:tetratricopeptide (TPR) repeat protein
MTLRIAWAIVFMLFAHGSIAAELLFNQYLSEAARNQNARNFDEAVRLHKLALEELLKLPDVPDKYVAAQMSNLSTAYSALQNFEEAVRYSSQAAELAMKDSIPLETRLHVLFNHGMILTRIGREAVGEGICQNTLSLIPSGNQQYELHRSSGLYCLALVNLKNGDFDAADAYYRQAHAIVAAITGALQNMEANYSEARAEAQVEAAELRDGNNDE